MTAFPADPWKSTLRNFCRPSSSLFVIQFVKVGREIQKRHAMIQPQKNQFQFLKNGQIG